MLEQRNLILAIAVSVAILLGFQIFYDAPRREAEQARQAALRSTEQVQDQSTSNRPVPADRNEAGAQVSVPGSESRNLPRAEALAISPRVNIDTDKLFGSISLRGAQIDDLILNNYNEELEDGSPRVTLLSPSQSENGYFAEFGWSAAGDAGIKLPGLDTLWTSNRETLTATTPVTLTWDNGEGLRFERTIALDEDYLFTVSQRVVNYGTASVTLFPFGLISRHGTPKTTRFFILHEGAIGVFDEILEQVDYGDMEDDGPIEETSVGGWIGITDKYWLVALVPDQREAITASFNHRLAGDEDRYRIDYLRDGVEIAAGDQVEVTNRLFAGAKVVRILDRYKKTLEIPLFDRAVDFGVLFFLTKPMFIVLRYLSDFVGNFGIGILLLTVIVKIIFFPLANKSYRAMSKMKLLAPEMKKIKERHKDSRQDQQKAMMELYKREKANPVSGCLPIVVQIPVFFALYKVLFVTIEMRHTPFFGWIHDLSAPDPLNLFEAFGMLQWGPPEIIPIIGIWPILMGLSMWLQQRLNPQPTDPMQARIFMFLPFFFVFLLGGFPAGLVIYWTWNNLLSVAQQWVIMRRAGVKNPAAIT
jgi:YidC/Oxa1 family membrane protein insertase